MTQKLIHVFALEKILGLMDKHVHLALKINQFGTAEPVLLAQLELTSIIIQRLVLYVLKDWFMFKPKDNV